ncbi:MAG TPA: methyltransferase domain-containing protein [Magnetospirillaceae bacterium]|jgi:SAM-dependent methyltransferase
MKDSQELHADQVKYWNGAGGGHWVDEQAHTDIMLMPVIDALLAAVDVRPGQHVLDVGCGCGATTIELAERVGPSGRVTGLDVSAPMLARARELSADLKNVDYIYILADAAAHDFGAPFADWLVSKFGVMFFGDPGAAFTNLKRALRPGAKLAFACWRPPKENPWMMEPLQAAYEFVPRLPKLDPEDPGPFSFSDPERVTRILTGAGFAKPRFTPVDLPIDLAAGKGLEAAVHQATNIGATSRALQDQPDALRAKVIESIRKLLTGYARGNSVALQGGIWIVEAG